MSAAFEPGDGAEHSWSAICAHEFRQAEMDAWLESERISARERIAASFDEGDLCELIDAGVLAAVKAGRGAEAGTLLVRAFNAYVAGAAERSAP